KGNPHSDRMGHKAVWHFYDMANSNRARPGGASHPALAQWQRLVTEAGTGKPEPRKIEAAAAALQKSFNLVDERSPFWIKEGTPTRQFPADIRASLSRLTKEPEGLKKNPPGPVNFANGAQEGGVPGSPHAGIHDVRIHIRGSYSRLGELVPRRFPHILAG